MHAVPNGPYFHCKMWWDVMGSFCLELVRCLSERWLRKGNACVLLRILHMNIMGLVWIAAKVVIYIFIYIRLYIIMHISYLTTSARGIGTMTLSWKGFQEFHIAVLYGISYYNSNIYITINSLYNAWDAVLNTFTNNNNKCLLLLYWTIRMRSLNFN